jgi:GTP-binding protein HflX
VIAVPELPREASRRSAESRVEEAEGLAQAIGIDVVAARPFRVRTVRPATLLGKGQVEEIAQAAEEKSEPR